MQKDVLICRPAAVEEGINDPDLCLSVKLAAFFKSKSQTSGPCQNLVNLISKAW